MNFEDSPNKKPEGDEYLKGCLPSIMSVLSWNCHGLGTPWAYQFLKDLTCQKKPNFIFLIEILYNNKRVETVRNSLNFGGAFTVETQGLGVVSLCCGDIMMRFSC